MAKNTLPLGAALLAVLPIAEGQITPIANPNFNINRGAGYVGVDLDGGGNDLQIKYNNNNLFGSILGGNLNALVGTAPGNTFYLANVANGASICPPQSFNSNSYFSFYFNDNGPFANFANNQEGFVGFRLTGNRYGWFRVRRESNNTRWVIVDGAYQNTPNTCIQAGSSGLPVTFQKFNASSAESLIRLDWQTATELNNAGFEVERSVDARSWQTLGFVSGKGTTETTQEYQFDDRELRTGQLYYYRLKQIDFDGAFAYSAIVSAELMRPDTDRPGFTPNPAAAGLTSLTYTSPAAAELQLDVFDVTGKLLLTETHGIATGENRLSLDWSSLGSGIFVVKLTRDGQSSYEKLIVE